MPSVLSLLSSSSHTAGCSPSTLFSHNKSNHTFFFFFSISVCLYIYSQNHRYVLLNGHRYHYIDEGKDSRSDENKTLVLLHGFPDTWFGWRKQIPFLVQLGYRVIVIDCIGYGETVSRERQGVGGPNVASAPNLPHITHRQLSLSLLFLWQKKGPAQMCWKWCSTLYL